MSSLHNRVETTVSAAADAIATADARFQQPSTVLQKRRWGRSCWNLYSCFGSYKHTSSSKRVGPAAPLSPGPARPGPVFPTTTNHHYRYNNNDINSNNNSSTHARPFQVPPSSPASFLPSQSPSCPHSPAGPASSTHTKPSNSWNAQIYAIGPYAHEADQLVSPPAFSSKFTTEPSTASYTSPPEPVRTPTGPSSPEVPFARLLSSSFVRKQGHDGNYDDNNCSNIDGYYSLSQYEFQPYHHVMSDYGTSPSFSIDASPHEPYYNWDSSSRSGYGTSLAENDNDGEFSYRDCSDIEVAWSLAWA